MSSRGRERDIGREKQLALAEDFCGIFHRDMDVLYWLALTLTADEGEAEQCFVAGLEECIEGNSVFKEWARSWSRRVVIKNAIRLLALRPGTPIGATPAPVPAIGGELDSQSAVARAALTRLQPFDRFVFVMSVLEGYSDRDCGTLLRCSSAEVIDARLRALRQIQQMVELSRSRVNVPGSESREAIVVYDTDAA